MLAAKPHTPPRLLRERGSEHLAFDVCVCAAGRSQRWGVDPPKVLAPVNGEPNLARLVRLLKARDKRYVVSCSLGLEDVVSHIADGNYFIGSGVCERNRFTNFDGMVRLGTVFLYGDTHYTEWDLDKLLDSEPGTFLLRLGPNRLTGKRWGEVFGFKLSSELVSRIDALPEDGKGWDLLGCRKPDLVRNSRAEPTYTYTPEPGFPLIYASLLTDDWDTWEEYVRFKEALDAAQAR